ncbi:hypothetical protein [Legionella pneumophila]|uniref:hypothetical protein n=1 Tax=Legionella pneumophila TaxID=446 RepID=UPI00249450F0|nr:hypothetical protein [Legionella pneumophila]
MKQKEDISACRNSLLDKQEKANSGMLDLQSKSKDLVTQLRDICKIHHGNLAEQEGPSFTHLIIRKGDY